MSPVASNAVAVCIGVPMFAIISAGDWWSFLGGLLLASSSFLLGASIGYRDGLKDAS